MSNIRELCLKHGFSDDQIECYGDDIAKIDYQKLSSKKNGKLVLITSTSPTISGEGKTTLTIGINDALCAMNKSSVAILREPSLGPVFGQKGGATGGGKCSLIPQKKINLHFTGDMHAISACNNLLAAIIDNHIYQGNALNIDINRIFFKRCIDINDRSLRDITLKNNRHENFCITAASEIMAIVCLATSLDDLKNKLGNILVAYTKDKKKVFAKDLKCINALCLLLEDALKPNVVRSLENNLVIVHGGPFANIAHGTASINAINLGLKTHNYTLVEAGFGSDMGGFKFYDIVCRINNLKPNVVIINTTIQSLKYNGNNNLSDGIKNLEYHIDNMLKFNSNILVVLNKFINDTQEQIDYVANFCKKKRVEFEICSAYNDGSKGALAVANKLITLADNDVDDVSFAYDLSDDLLTKINKVAKNYFNAKQVIINEDIEEKFQLISKEFSTLPICIAKTPTSISDNKNLLGYPKNFVMHVSDISVSSGAGFIVVYMGNVLTLPGLSKNANYLRM